MEKLYSELFSVITAMGETYIAKLPQEFWQIVSSQCNSRYAPTIALDKTLDEQNLSKDALAMIAYINLNYWCETDEEKQSYLSKLEINEQKFLKKLESASNIRGILNLLTQKE